MEKLLSTLEMLQDVKYTLSTNSDLLYPISDEILAYSDCLNRINDFNEGEVIINSPELNALIRKTLVPRFKFIASILISYGVMAEQTEFLCNFNLKEKDIEILNSYNLISNLSCYLKFCKENICFLSLLGLTEDFIIRTENDLKDIVSSLNFRTTSKENVELNKIIFEAKDILENEIDNYITNKKNELPQLYREYVKARQMKLNENNSLRVA